jgi:hypothetical protein
VVARNGNKIAPEAPQERSRALVLIATPAVGQIAACNDQLRVDALDQAHQGPLDRCILARAGVEIGNVEKTQRQPPMQPIDSRA